MNGLSPVWMMVCRERWPLVVKALSQTLQTYLLRARLSALAAVCALECIGVGSGETLLAVTGEGNFLNDGCCFPDANGVELPEVDAAGAELVWPLSRLAGLRREISLPEAA